RYFSFYFFAIFLDLHANILRDSARSYIAALLFIFAIFATWWADYLGLGARMLPPNPLQILGNALRGMKHGHGAEPSAADDEHCSSFRRPPGTSRRCSFCEIIKVAHSVFQMRSAVSVSDGSILI